ncbi:hypothetical protein [Nitratifractor sp.]
MRYVIETGKDYLSFWGEAEPQLDPYGFTFDGRRFESDHYLDDQMKCRRELPGQFRCRSEEDPYETKTILYRRQGRGKFDFLIYRGGADAGRSPQLEMRLYSDGRRIYDLFYEDGGIVPSRSEIYSIAEIGRSPAPQSPPRGSGRSGR